MNFLIVCGGTAGHINPALAVAQEILRRLPDAKILFAGAGKAMEKKLIPAAGFHLVNIKMSGLRRSLSPENIAYNLGTLRSLATAGIKAGNLISRFKPSAVIGTGGYICYPILKKASRMGIPTVIHGSDAVPGLTTKMLSAYVDRVLVSFKGLEGLYKRPERVVFTGTPVRMDFDASGGRQDSKSDSKLVVSFWGSLGARKMNEAMAGFISLNVKERRFNHIHAAGEAGGVEAMYRKLESMGVSMPLPQGIEIREYISDMPAVMADSDLVLSRAGASTIAELSILGKPAVLVPSPFVTNNHQAENARQLAKAGGVVVMLEGDCTGEKLFKAVSGILSNEAKLEKMSEAQKALAAPDAAKKITDIVFGLCNI